ncbi:MAG: hypothetical protein SFU27_07010 [Thermonemataceae bacterium]|nr:hypothetical protein [Thermonemataceae bacterium]
MKKILFLVFYLVCSYTVFSQLPNTNFSVNGKNFLVSTSEGFYTYVFAGSPIETGQIRPTSAPSPECACSLNGYCDDFYSFEYKKPDFLRFYNIFREVFPKQRVFDMLDRISNGSATKFILEMSIDDKGNLLEVRYVIPKELAEVLQSTELEKLDTKLLSSMKFSLKAGHVCSGMTIIHLFSGGNGYYLSLSDLYDEYGYGRGNYWKNTDDILQLMLEDGEDPRR